MPTVPATATATAVVGALGPIDVRSVALEGGD